MHKFIFPGSNSGTFVFEFFYDWSCKITMPIGLSNDTEKSAYQEYYIDLGFDEEKVNKFNLVSGSEIEGRRFCGIPSVIPRQRFFYKAFWTEYECGWSMK